MHLMFMCVLGCYVASTVLLVPKFLEGIDCISEQLWGDKECPFSDVTNSGRVWRKVLESDGGVWGPGLHRKHWDQPYFNIKWTMFDRLILSAYGKAGPRITALNQQYFNIKWTMFDGLILSADGKAGAQDYTGSIEPTVLQHKVNYVWWVDSVCRWRSCL